MILGRPTNLWIGFLGALFNLSVLFHWFGFAPTPEQIAGVNSFILLAIGLIANTPSGDNTPKALAGKPTTR